MARSVEKLPRRLVEKDFGDGPYRERRGRGNRDWARMYKSGHSWASEKWLEGN